MFFQNNKASNQDSTRRSVNPQGTVSAHANGTKFPTGELEAEASQPRVLRSKRHQSREEIQDNRTWNCICQPDDVIDRGNCPGKKKLHDTQKRVTRPEKGIDVDIERSSSNTRSSCPGLKNEENQGADDVNLEGPGSAHAYKSGIRVIQRYVQHTWA